jgi:hypothetical protein
MGDSLMVKTPDGKWYFPLFVSIFVEIYKAFIVFQVYVKKMLEPRPEYLWNRPGNGNE